MSVKNLPFSPKRLSQILEEYPTPFHIYDEKAIRENARSFLKAFSWVPGGFKNYFAVKALPNPSILQILKEEGMGADCSSLPEILLSQKVGMNGEEIMFTSNDTPANEYIQAKATGAIINLDDISHIDYLNDIVGMPSLICFRYNPGPLKEGNVLIGKPQEAKYGFTKEQLFEGYKKAKALGATRFGLHTMVASNELNYEYFIETAKILFDLVVEIKQKLDINIEFVNLGGGIGIPYKLEDNAVNLEAISNGIKAAYQSTIEKNGLTLRIVMECGRMVTGPYGYLVSKVLHRKKTYKTFIGLDACMANLMRPALYGAYHHISVIKQNELSCDKATPYIPQINETECCDVTGSLCENNDKFAIDRTVPKMERGDIVVIHDTGAHGYAMGFNYNGKLRSAELLLCQDNSVKLIRRAETVDDYFATLVFPKE